MDDDAERESLERERADLIERAETLGQRPDALTPSVTDALVAIQARVREIDRRLVDLAGGDAVPDDG